MKTDAKSLLMFFAFFSVMTNLLYSYFFNNSIALLNNVPSLKNAIDWNSAYLTAYNAMGGGQVNAFVVGPLINWLAGYLAYPVGAFVWLGNMLGWFAAMVGWVFSFISPPYYLAFGQMIGSVLSGLTWLIIGISLLFAIRTPGGAGLES